MRFPVLQFSKTRLAAWFGAFLTVTAVVAGLTVGPTVGQETAPAEVSTRTRQLVLQLNAEELSQRQAAEKALIEMGPEILKYLPRTSRRTPAEVRQRLLRVIKAVESVAAKKAVEATRVSLSGKMPLADVFAAFEKQTGNRIVGFENSSPEIEVKFDKAPYWQALDTVLDKANLTVNAFSNESNQLTVMARPDNQADRVGRAHYSGLFRFEPIRIQATRDLLNPSVEGLRLTLTVGWEPRLQPISLSQPFAQVTATHDQDGELEMEAEGQQNVGVRPGAATAELDLPFSLPSRDIKKIKSLKGELIAMLPGRLEKFEFKRLRNISNLELRRAGVTVTLERVRKNQELFKIYIRLRFDDAANALESHRGWVYGNKAYVVNRKGKRFDYASSETTFSDDNEVGLAYIFDLEEGLDAYRFVYETPAMIIRLPVKYELKDIELP